MKRFLSIAFILTLAFASSFAAPSFLGYGNKDMVFWTGSINCPNIPDGTFLSEISWETYRCTLGSFGKKPSELKITLTLDDHIANVHQTFIIGYDDGHSMAIPYENLCKPNYIDDWNYYRVRVWASFKDGRLVKLETNDAKIKSYN